MSNLVLYVGVCIAKEEDVDKVLRIKASNNNVESGKLNNSSYKYTTNEGNWRTIRLQEGSYCSDRVSSQAAMHGTDVANYSTHCDIGIVDCLCSGDKFMGTMIYNLNIDKDNKDAIEFAVTVSCLKHLIEGVFNRVTVTDMANPM